MYKYDIGGQERKSEVNEGIADIPQNRTLLIQQLTDEPPLAPQIVPDLRTTADVFNYFKPSKEVVFETEEGSSRMEQLNFTNLADFGKQGISKQSAFLDELTHQCDDLQKFILQLKSNKILRTLLENKDAKASYLAAIAALITELEQPA